VPIRKPGFSWPSCSLVLLFVFFVCPLALCQGNPVLMFHPRTFGGHREQQLDVVDAYFGTQCSTEGATTPSPDDAVGLSQLSLPQPAQPGTSTLAFGANDEAAARTCGYTDQCTGTPPGAAPNTGPYRRSRLPDSFL
jgi:hypothetical protein